ncbi:hypothetical protein HYW84_04490 [Candidatus Peregrinibacteria bacterium]|nr:hypothetical protein [Candidatus Peregrinibacteria bacterium]
MPDDITNGVLLQHMQGMKNDLQEQISGVKEEVGGIKKQIIRLEQKMDQGFEDASRHRQALQEDLKETMRVQGTHGVKLARL